MPPKTRSTRSTKNLKENIGVVNKANKRAVGKITKPARKALADKTNSASDDNTSAECMKEVLTKHSVIKEKNKSDNEDQRPRRDRRLPNRFVENQVLKRLSLSHNKESIPISPVSKPSSDSINVSSTSTFKTPPKPAETSLVANRPRRVCRLPSKFEDHSISPNKFIPVQPAYASTPIAQKTAIPKHNDEGKKSSKSEQAKVLSSDKKSEKKTVKKDDEKSTSNDSISNVKVCTGENKKKAAPDSNNNAFKKNLRARKPPAAESKAVTNDKSTKTPSKAKSPVKSVTPKKVVLPKKAVSPKKIKPLNKNFSFKVLEENKKQESNNKDDVYEFTFDPNEEPAPQKKKKRVVKKKPAKPRTVVFKHNYDKNVNKALAALKNVVSKKPVEDIASKAPKPVEKIPTVDKVNVPQAKPMAKTTTTNASMSIPQIQRNVASKIIIGGIQSPKQNGTQNTQVQSNKASPKILSNKVTVPEPNKSIQPEDIAADFDIPDLNYSPVNSPNVANTSDVPNQTPNRSVHNTDPLKLREHISFFDDHPAASSSMNSSTRQPQASPWRVEFENLPIRWHVNSYVKPNMTPAMECSFVNFEDKNKKKHVYTNLVPESNDTLPEIAEKQQPNLIQTSIISFIREAMEKSSSKKKREKSVTPAPLFLDSTNKTPNKNGETVTNRNTGKASRQLFTPRKDKSADNSKNSSNATNKSSVNENGQESIGQKRKNLEEINEKPAKTPRKDKDNTFFGFDDSENVDQENISPKKNGRKRTLRPRNRAILKELNEPSGPTRAIVPVAAKTARKAEIEKLYEEMKSSTDAPVFPDKEMDNVATTDVNEALDEMLNEDDTNSVHLFEDIEVVHHTKPQRKSYGKAKVTFRRVSSDSTTQETGRNREDSDDEEDLNDLTFDPGVPFIEEKKTRKKQTKRQKMTKKEEEEAEAWAVNFNSMCEDVEEFPLIFE